MARPKFVELSSSGTSKRVKITGTYDEGGSVHSFLFDRSQLSFDPSEVFTELTFEVTNPAGTWDFQVRGPSGAWTTLEAGVTGAALFFFGQRAAFIPAGTATVPGRYDGFRIKRGAADATMVVYLQANQWVG